MATKCAYCGGIRPLKGNCRGCGSKTFITSGHSIRHLAPEPSFLKVMAGSTLAVACLVGGCYYQAKRDVARMMAPIKDRQVAFQKANLAVITEVQQKLQSEATKARVVNGGAARLDDIREAEERAESLANEFRANLRRLEKES